MQAEVAKRVVDEEFGELQLALECQLCKEGFKAPVMLPCGHSFCSLCIRRSMQLLQCCPVCRESCGENDLRKNIILQQLTDHLELLPARICARLAHPSGDKSAAENLRRKDPTFKAASTIAKHIAGKRNYNLTSEKDLRNMCKSWGLPEKGDKRTLEKLHREYVIRFNAQVDRGIPRSEADIRSQVAREIVAEYKSAQTTRPGSSNIFERAAAGRADKAAVLASCDSPGDAAVHNVAVGSRPGHVGHGADQDLFAKLIREIRERKQQGRQAAEPGAGGRESGGADMRHGGHESSGYPGAAEGPECVGSGGHLEISLREQPRGSLEEDVADGEGSEGTAGELQGADGELAPADRCVVSPVPAPWVAVFSDVANRAFYYNTETNIGTFDPPPKRRRTDKSPALRSSVMSQPSQSHSRAVCGGGSGSRAREGGRAAEEASSVVSSPLQPAGWHTKYSEADSASGTPAGAEGAWVPGDEVGDQVGWNGKEALEDTQGCDLGTRLGLESQAAGGRGGGGKELAGLAGDALGRNEQAGVGGAESSGEVERIPDSEGEGMSQDVVCIDD